MKYETDSRKIMPGQTFVAIKGHTVDGHDYIDEAIKNGATQIIAEKDITAEVPVKVVKDTNEYLKEHLLKEYSHLLKDIVMIGVTGTNGKTTTCYLTYQFLKKLNLKVAYLGTIGFYFLDEEITINNTTPDMLTIYKLLLNAREKGCTHLVMEVSSHSLYYERIAGLQFKAGAFTNLTIDHLDFHKTMENYLKEKLKLLNYLEPDAPFIVNIDDAAANNFIAKWSNTITLGINGDIKINNYKIYPNETFLNFSYQNKNYDINYNLTSKFNIYNFLTALFLVKSLGYSLEELIKIIPDIKAPKGRCETYKMKDRFIVIDYAHTPDAVLKIIEAYKEIKEGKLFTILGCGGDRDPLKRPIMGEVATRLSDYVIFTNDNPRTEEPTKIMEDILKGVEKDNYEVIYDRKEAIKEAINMLNSNDILLILGKGHEDYQIIGHTKYHLSDKEEVLKYI